MACVVILGSWCLGIWVAAHCQHLSCHDWKHLRLVMNFHQCHIFNTQTLNYTAYFDDFSSRPVIFIPLGLQLSSHQYSAKDCTSYYMMQFFHPYSKNTSLAVLLQINKNSQDCWVLLTFCTHKFVLLSCANTWSSWLSHGIQQNSEKNWFFFFSINSICG